MTMVEDLSIWLFQALGVLVFFWLMIQLGRLVGAMATRATKPSDLDALSQREIEIREERICHLERELKIAREAIKGLEAMLDEYQS